MNQREWNMVIRRLEEAGLPASDFGVFTTCRQTDFDDRASVPILLELLPELKDAAVKESIVRHLTTKHASPVAAKPLIEEFEKTLGPNWSLKWAIGNALDTVATNDDLNDLLRLVRDPSHGMGRQMLVSRLGRGPKLPEIADALLRLLGDEDVVLQAISALRQQIGNAEARPHVEKLLDHPNPKIREQAARGLKKIDKALSARGTESR